MGLLRRCGDLLGYLSYAKGLPLTIRSGLQPLFGNSLSGWLGHAVDIAAILATLIGLGVTIGYGVSQFAAGLFNISAFEMLVDAAGKPTLAAQILGLVVIVSISCVSAMSGIQRGIKWLSNINMGLSIFLVMFFIAFGSTVFAVITFGYAIWDYLLALPAMSVTVWNDASTEIGAALQQWQGAWNIFIGLGGSPSLRSLVCFWPGYQKGAPSANTSWGLLSCQPSFA